MKVLVVGSGAREHAIVWKLLQDQRVRDVFVAPGNAGTALIARNLEIKATDIQAVADAALQNGIELVVVGPEDPLALGLADVVRAYGIPVFGPSRAAAQIESSKWFAKELMRRAGIPTAAAERFTSLYEARAYVRYRGAPLVIKADGLTAGKGVTVAETTEEALAALDRLMAEGVFGEAGATVVVEERLVGREVSLMAFVDGETVVPMVPACDYKRARDGDTGPNTGGMGGYSPPAFFGPAEVAAATETILRPAARALAEAGSPFQGALYAGLMVTEDGPKVLEFNCRFGDPEAEIVLPRLRTPLLDIMLATVQGRLADQPVEWDPAPCVGVVVASEGYPEQPRTGRPVAGLDRAEPGTLVFHAGTRLVARTERPFFARRGQLAPVVAAGPNEVVTSGGRVLTVVAKAPTIAEARRRAYATVERIAIEGAFFRRDIAAREADGERLEDAKDACPHPDPLPGGEGSAPFPPHPVSPSAYVPGAEAVARLEEAVRGLEGETPGFAMQALREMVDDYPEWAAPARALADANMRLERYAEAAMAWNRVARLEPRDAVVHHNLAAIHVRQGAYELAELEMREALERDPNYVDALAGLATLLSRRGDHAGAIEQLERALALDPRSAALQLDYAMLLERAGEREQAFERARYAAQLAEDPALRAEAERFARRLGGRRWFG